MTQPARTDGSLPRAGEAPIVRRACPQDLERIVSLDALTSGVSKPDYWHDMFERYLERKPRERFVLVADMPGEKPPLAGFILGEIRAWEFGSEPCGWVIWLSVDPQLRERRVGEALFHALVAEFRTAGIRVMRTMVARQNHLHLAFFRGEGMRAGSYLQLEMDVE